MAWGDIDLDRRLWICRGSSRRLIAPTKWRYRIWPWRSSPACPGSATAGSSRRTGSAARGPCPAFPSSSELDQSSGVEGGFTTCAEPRSGMARLGHPPHVVAAILNHAPGATMGITAVYLRHRFSDRETLHTQHLRVASWGGSLAWRGKGRDLAARQGLIHAAQTRADRPPARAARLRVTPPEQPAAAARDGARPVREAGAIRLGRREAIRWRSRDAADRLFRRYRRQQPELLAEAQLIASLLLEEPDGRAAGRGPGRAAGMRSRRSGVFELAIAGERAEAAA